VQCAVHERVARNFEQCTSACCLACGDARPGGAGAAAPPLSVLPVAALEAGIARRLAAQATGALTSRLRTVRAAACVVARRRVVVAAELRLAAVASATTGNAELAGTWQTFV